MADTWKNFISMHLSKQAIVSVMFYSWLFAIS